MCLGDLSLGFFLFFGILRVKFSFRFFGYKMKFFIFRDGEGVLFLDVIDNIINERIVRFLK